MQFEATIQSCSGAWVWLIIILVVVSCTHLFLYFLHLFNSVPFKNFWKILLCLVSLLFIVPWTNFAFKLFTVIILNAVCSVHTRYDGFCETVIYIIQQPFNWSEKQSVGCHY